MSYGFTPYDKKSYKESKRRIKQALKAEKTGKIKPYGNSKRKVIVCIIAVVIVIAVAVCCIYNLTREDILSKSESSAEIVSQEDLLILVNRQNQITKDYLPDLKDFKGFKVNTIAYENLESLFEKAEQEGVEIKITSAYISFEEQNELYNIKLNEFLSNPDYTTVRAQAETQKYVPQAGCSESQTGLLVEFDITDVYTRSFIERNCVNYGFVLRYPQDKEDVTHLKSSDTLYRYVGKDNAIKMRSYGMCLEEYNEYLAMQNNIK